MGSNKKLKFVIGGLVIVAAIASLAFFAVRENMVYYYTVTELQGKGPSTNVQGLGRPGRRHASRRAAWASPSPSRSTTRPRPNKRPVRDVHRRGARHVPGAAAEEPAPEVVVEGDYLSEGSSTRLDLLAKCPTKYEGRPGGGGDGTSATQ